MKRATVVLSFTLATLLVPSLALGQKPKAQTKHAPSDEETAVITLEQRAMQAFVKGDPAAFGSAAGGSFVMVTPAGARTFTTELAAAEMKACTTTSYTGTNVQTTPYGPDVIVVTYDAQIEQTCGGKPASEKWHALTVWRRSIGRWVAVAHSQTPIARS